MVERPRKTGGEGFRVCVYGSGEKKITDQRVGNRDRKGGQTSPRTQRTGR